MFKKAFTTLALLGWSAAASATPINLDTIQNHFDTVLHGANTSFLDQFTFTVPADFVGGASAVSLETPLILPTGNFSLYSISNLTVTQDAASLNPLSFTAIHDKATNAITGYQYNTLLSAGSYSFDVSGIAVGVSGGAYTAGFFILPAATAASIPLPSAAWLLGSALAGLVSVSRRGKRVA